jgi:riboflavin biosynthesis pyrimidine reductase
MTDGSLDMLWPEPGAGLDDDAVLAAYAVPDAPLLRMNFVTSLDGAATHEGRSGGLGGPGDRRVFALLRRLADVVLVGAGTVRVEGYGGMRLGDDDAVWRLDHDMAAHPVFALVSRTLDLDAASTVFTDAPVRPVVYTVTATPQARRAALAEVADVVEVGDESVDPVRMRADLVARGLPHIHSEGGPTLFGSFVAAGVVDELCLTLAPSIQGGSAGRITHDPRSAPTGMALRSVLRSGSELLLRYAR